MKDKKLESVIISTARQLDDVFNSLADEMRLGVKKYGISYKKPFWKHNKQLYKYVNKKIKAYNAINVGIIKGNARKAWDVSNSEMNKKVIDYLKQKEANYLLESKVYKQVQQKVLFMDTPVLADWVQTNIPQYQTFISRVDNGIGLSGRVWKMSLKSRRMIKETLKSGILEGQSASQMSRIFRQALRNPNKLFRRVRNKETGELELSTPAKSFKPGRGMYRSSYQNAYRLARTEINMSYRKAENVRINQIPFVVGYDVHLSNAHPQTDICDDMIGRYPKNFTFLGWHPACICYTTTVLLDDKNFDKYLKTGTISTNTYVKNIPNNAMTYIKNNKTKIENLKNIPYWYGENKRYTE